MSINFNSKDKNGNVVNILLENNPTITITNVDLDEVVTINASAVTPTGQQPHIESVQFIGPSRAGQPITKH
jgi:hypothetical protein